MERASEASRMTPEVESRKSDGGSTVTSKKSAKELLKESISTSPERGASLPTKKEEKKPKRATKSGLFLLHMMT